MLWSSCKENATIVDYKAPTTSKNIRKKAANDGDAPDVYLNARYKYHITTFYTIDNILKTDLKKSNI